MQLNYKKKIKKEKLSWNDLHADGSVYVYYLKSDSTGEIKGIKEEMYKKEKKRENKWAKRESSKTELELVDHRINPIPITNLIL